MRKAELWRDALASGIDQKADFASIKVNHSIPAHFRKQSSIRGRTHTSSLLSAVMAFSFRRSTAK